MPPVSGEKVLKNHRGKVLIINGQPVAAFLVNNRPLRAAALWYGYRTRVGEWLEEQQRLADEFLEVHDVSRKVLKRLLVGA